MRRVVFHNRPGMALNRQTRIDQYGFPFTLNPLIGCFFECKYCYVPEFTKNSREWFFNEVQVKGWLPEKLDQELTVYQDLPQHLKRVQMNESCESYLPKVMKSLKKNFGRDLMAEILGVFEKHWLAGNQWMVHILTKSNLITRHVEILSRLKHMVQLEISFACLDEKLRRQLERYAPSTEKRLRAVKQLSDAGIFVRIMAMPLICDKEQGEELRKVAFENGAKAFKNKGLNYFNLKDLLDGKVIKKQGRRDFVHEDLTVKSGEHILENGRIRKARLLMPEKWKGNKIYDWKAYLVERDVEMIDCGYSECNDIDWGYIM
jgi:DNA repair photolyase